MFTSNVILAGSDTLSEDVPVAYTTLGKYDLLMEEERRAVTQATVDALPPNTVAHRLGDCVFAYHGIDFKKLKGNQPLDLWVVILWPDPDLNQPPSANEQIWVGRANGGAFMLPVNAFDAMLAVQNAERAKLGLSPLPHPSKVTHTQPAVAGHGEPADEQISP